MKKFRVEYGFEENFMSVDEWQTIDGLQAVEAESAEAAAEWAACTDGLEGALFRVYELTEDEFGGLEVAGAPEYFDFSGDGAEEAAPAEEWVNQDSVLVDTIRGNQVYRANRTAWRSQYSAEEWRSLLAGEEVPSDFDEDGNPVEWETIHREEEG